MRSWARRGRLAGLAALWLGCSPLGAQQGQPADTLRIEFLDVNQADAILIKLGSRAVLVDASRGDDIVQYLEEEGIDSLVAAIVSHNHEDHIGGMVSFQSGSPRSLGEQQQSRRAGGAGQLQGADDG